MSKLHPTLLVMCLSVAACTTSMSPGTTPSAYDGTYRGMAQSTQYSWPNPNCSAGDMAGKQANLVVQNGRVIWTPVPGRTVYAPIMQNGAFSATYASSGNGSMQISGTVTQTSIMARADDGTCHRTYNLQRSQT
jgi:hypothetical protein